MKTFANWVLIFLAVTRGVNAVQAAGSGDSPTSSFFGKERSEEGALIGILYDLKQTQDHQKTDVKNSSYSEVVDEYLSKNWDEAVLGRFYRATRPLYSTQIFVPFMNADAAPQAFEVQDTVQPSLWLIHYKGQVVPPETGRYRFVGYSDDWVAVAVNGKTVLIGNHGGTKFPKTNWKTTEKFGMKATNGWLVYGDWVDFKKGEPVDLDIAMGERPGGFFSAFLLIQKEGESYEMLDNRHPILPIFQLTRRETARPGNPDDAPVFAREGKPWKALQ